MNGISSVMGNDSDDGILPAVQLDSMNRDFPVAIVCTLLPGTMHNDKHNGKSRLRRRENIGAVSFVPGDGHCAATRLTQKSGGGLRKLAGLLPIPGVR
jgi:hypothetical protein